MKRMKNAVRIIAALMIAVMVLSTAAFAEELTDENFEPMDEMIAAEIAGEEEIFEAAAEDEVFDEAAEEEIFEETEWGDAEVADVAEVDDEAAAGAGEEGEGAALVTGGEEIVAESEEEENEAAQGEGEENEAAQGEEEESEAAEDDGELGMDLLAAFDEADMPEIVEEAEEVDRTAMMATLINEAMDARQDEGINAALDNTFATLARNAMELANPETGVIEVSGKEIVSMTVNAAQDRFGATREKTLGAVAAAASRADEMGYIQALGGDARLVSLAISDIEKEAAKQSRKIVKAAYDSALESIAVANPMFKPYVPLLKALTAYMFEDHFASDPNAEIKAELAKIQAQITETKQDLKDHAYNVVTLSNIGDKYFSLEEWAETVRERLGNIVRSTSKSEAQKLNEIAAMYDSTAFQNLMSAMNGATLCFTSPNNEIFGGYNIFDATYRRACEEVMFSKEAIDISMPYLLSQLSCYTAACVIMEEVFNAYEEVWGAGTLEESREKMLIRLTGMNLEGQPAGKSVYNLFNDFCNRDKFIFVNKNNRTNIKINPNLRVVPYFGKRYTNEKMQWNKRDLPDFVQNCPLNADQMKALADYVNQKNTLLILFLAEIGFRGNYDIDVNESLNGLDYYMPTGAQNTVSVKDSSSSSGYYTKREIQINAIQIWRLGATDRKVTLRTIESSTSSYSDKPSTVHLMVFQPR